MNKEKRQKFQEKYKKPSLKNFEINFQKNFYTKAVAGVLTFTLIFESWKSVGKWRCYYDWNIDQI